MKTINPYLTFDGTAREAMSFYAKNLGGQLEMQTFKEAGMAGPKDDPNRVIHAKLSVGSLVIMASDSPPGLPVNHGDGTWISIECDDVAEIEKLFKAFGDGGTVIMPLQDQFWGARFGMIKDKYNIRWMFNCYLPKK